LSEQGSEGTPHVLTDRRKQWSEAAYLDGLKRLSRLIELRDDKTGEHTVRVSRLSTLIAQNLHLSPEEVWLIHHAAPLHDLGKVVIPDRILLKTGPLDDKERTIMQSHTTAATEILGRDTHSTALQMAEQIARHHHERWDGEGYPDRLKGAEIPLGARIVAVADAYDKMMHDLPYRTALPLEAVVEEFKHESGWQFDPEVVRALVCLLDAKGNQPPLKLPTAAKEP